MGEPQMPYAADNWQQQGYSSPEAEIDDMANVGRALMEALPEGYHYNDCPSEIVSDLLNRIADLEASIDKAIADERAAVVAWLKLWSPSRPIQNTIARELAAEAEQGAHHKWLAARAARDSDRSGEAMETENTGSTEGESAGLEEASPK